MKFGTGHLFLFATIVMIASANGFASEGTISSGGALPSVSLQELSCATSFIVVGEVVRFQEDGYQVSTLLKTPEIEKNFVVFDTVELKVKEVLKGSEIKDFGWPAVSVHEPAYLLANQHSAHDRAPWSVSVGQKGVWFLSKAKDPYTNFRFVDPVSFSSREIQVPMPTTDSERIREILKKCRSKK